MVFSRACDRSESLHRMIDEYLAPYFRLLDRYYEMIHNEPWYDGRRDSLAQQMDHLWRELVDGCSRKGKGARTNLGKRLAQHGVEETNLLYQAVSHATSRYEAHLS